MKHPTSWTFGAVFLAALTFIAPLVRAQDIAQIAPKNCKVLLDNGRVRVVRVVTKPGEKIETHSHPANIVYALTSAKVKFTSADGKTEDRELKAGQAVWSDAVTHSTENIGTSESRALVIELKK